MKRFALLLILATFSAIAISACNNKTAEIQSENASSSASASQDIVNPANTNIAKGSIEILPSKKSEVTSSITITNTNITKEKVVSELPSAVNALINYSESKFKTLKGNQPVALFFYAGWCPACRSMEQSIKANPSILPTGITLFKVDYDSEEALKKEYKITQQSTWIILDKNGKLVATNPGIDYNSLASDLKKAL